MIKLFTLENLSAFSSDAVYKICLTLEADGLLDENIQSFENNGAMLNAARFAAEDGDSVLVAVETGEFFEVKRNLIAALGLAERFSPEIASRMAQFSQEDDDATLAVDTQAHCIIADGSTPLLTEDGLFSGFTVPSGNGTVSLLPLDFSRLDQVLEALQRSFFAPEEPVASAETPAEAPAEAPDTTTVDFATPARRVVASLSQSGSRLALAQGEAVSWLAQLPQDVERFSECVEFVPVDEEPLDAQGQPTEETPFAAVLRKAKDARARAGAEYGAAISDIFSDERVDGQSFFALVAVSDESGTKAKKITTSSDADLRLMLPHCIMVLFDTICQKAQSADEEDQTLALTPETAAAPQDKKVSKGIVAFAVIVLLAAILIPGILVWRTMNKTEPQQSTAAPSSNQSVSDSMAASTQTPTESTSSVFPTASTAPTSPTSPTTVTPGNYLPPAEPGATDVSATPTAAAAPSTSGTFTFYVFGYGHGVGLSQNGANYLAGIGWDYAQILSNYYYGTTLVFGDTYPATITYGGAAYETRQYLASALESEVSGSFHREALKAQAVALYTFAKHNNFNLSTSANAYGKEPSQLCLSVVDEVMQAGLYLAYNGQTALTPFHSISAGKTTSFANVWGGSVDYPYLAGGRPSAFDQSASGYQTTFSISSADLKALASKNLSVELNGDPSTWITILTHDQAVNADIGYVSTVNVGGKVITGNEFRSKLMEGRIRSHCFKLVYTPGA